MKLSTNVKVEPLLGIKKKGENLMPEAKGASRIEWLALCSVNSAANLGLYAS